MKQTNSEFAKLNEVFKKACELAKVETTSRQASKFRMKMGLAFKMKRMAITTLKNKKEVAEALIAKSKKVAETNSLAKKILPNDSGIRTSTDYRR